MNPSKLLSPLRRWLRGRYTSTDRAPDSTELALYRDRFFLHRDELRLEVFPVVAVEGGARQVDFAEDARSMRRDEGVARMTFLPGGRSSCEWRDGESDFLHVFEFLNFRGTWPSERSARGRYWAAGRGPASASCRASTIGGYTASQLAMNLSGRTGFMIAASTPCAGGLHLAAMTPGEG